MALEMELSTQVTSGQIVANFEAFRDAVQQELDGRFNSLVVTEDSLRETKDTLAKLRKVKAQIRDTMRSVAADYDKPLEVTRAQAKELEAILDRSIAHLDEQVKEIEASQHAEKLEEAWNIYREVLDTFPEAVGVFAQQCDWIVKDSWGNKTVRDKQIRDESKQALESIVLAFDLFDQHPFRAQVLDNFRQTGSISGAQAYGRTLIEQQERAAALQKAMEDKAAPPAAPVQEPEQKPEPVPAPEVKTENKDELPTPDSFMTEDGPAMCSGYFRIRAMRYQLLWLMHICGQYGMDMRKLTKEDLISIGNKFSKGE